MVVTIENQTENLEYDPEKIETLGNAKSPLKEKKTFSQYRLDVSIPFIKDHSLESGGCLDCVKRIFPSLVFDVILPSLDVYSDLSLVLSWYWNGHWKYALSMTIPLILQFLFTVYKWFRLEKRENKRKSWPLLLLQCWPQWRAIRIMKLDAQNDKKAEMKKKELMREVISTEPFLEGLPSILVMTIIWVSAFPNGQITPETINPSPEFCENRPDNNRCAIFSGIGGAPWFFASYAISIITGSLGVTKFLQIGPFSVLTIVGPLGGLCKGRFILVLLSVLTSVVTKCLFMALFLVFTLGGLSKMSLQSYRNVVEILGTYGHTESLVVMLLILFGLLIVPNLIFALISIACSAGLNKKLFQIIISYPAAWMLPIFTYFTIGPRKLLCCSHSHSNHHQLGLSSLCTCINIILTAISYITMILYFSAGNIFIYLPNGRITFLEFWSPVLVVGITLILIYLLIDLPFVKTNRYYIANCCCQNFPVTVQVLDVSHDELEIIQIHS